MKDKVTLALHFLKLFIEEWWLLVVILWNLPVGVVELVWTGLFDREKFKYNCGLLKDLIKGKRYEL